MILFLINLLEKPCTYTVSRINIDKPIILFKSNKVFLINSEFLILPFSKQINYLIGVGYDAEITILNQIQFFRYSGLKTLEYLSYKNLKIDFGSFLTLLR